jgi:hypothetical protein
MNAASSRLESRCEFILRRHSRPLTIRTDQGITQSLRGVFARKPEVWRVLVEQLAPPHHTEVFRPMHRKLYVPQSSCFEVVLRILHLLRIHGFGKSLEALSSEFGQQTREVTKMVSRGTMGNARLTRTGAQRQSLHAGVPYDLLRGFQQGGAKVSMVISVTFARCRSFLSGTSGHGF